jgi:hypothetical protein
MKIIFKVTKSLHLNAILTILFEIYLEFSAKSLESFMT